MQTHSVLGPGRAGYGRLHRRKVKLEYVTVGRILQSRVEKTGCSRVLLHDVGLVSSVRHLQIGYRLLIHGEESHRGTVFRCHIRDGGSVRNRQLFHTRAEVFHELFNHPVFSDQLREAEDKVRGCNTFSDLAVQLHTDDLRDLHVVGLSKHHGLCFYPADAPTQNADPVDHRCVRVRTHKGIRECHLGPVSFLGDHDPSQVFEIYLMADA